MARHLHMQCTPKSRRGGAHALDLAAYRAGTRYKVPMGRHEPRERHTRDHRDRTDVRFSTIILPSDRKAPHWARNRVAMWTRADAAEIRCDARIAREWIVALPRELPNRRANRLAKAIARKLANRYGCIVDLSVHIGTDRYGRPQPHAHLPCTTRLLEAQGFGRKTTIEWLEKQLAEEGLAAGRDQIATIRRQIATLTNNALVSAGLACLVEHRSYATMGLDLIGSGRPKRHGSRRPSTRRQLARLRRGTSGPGLSEAGRRLVNATVVASEPMAFIEALKTNGGTPRLAAIREALRPLVREDVIENLTANLNGQVGVVERADPNGNTGVLKAAETLSSALPQLALSSSPSTAALEPGAPRVRLLVRAPKAESREADPNVCDGVSTQQRSDGHAYDWFANEACELPGSDVPLNHERERRAGRERRNRETAELRRAYTEQFQRRLNDLDAILERLRSRPVITRKAAPNRNGRDRFYGHGWGGRSRALRIGMLAERMTGVAPTAHDADRRSG